MPSLLLSPVELLKLGTYLITALPAAWVFSRVLKSSTLVRRRGAEIGGAAGAFVATLLLSVAIFQQQLNLPPPVSPQSLRGTWEVYNESELDLLGVWTFRPRTEDQVAVEGTVFQAEDPTRLLRQGSMEPVISFEAVAGLLPESGAVEFDYVSELGSGHVNLSTGIGLRGSYRDEEIDPGRGEADRGEILLLRESSGQEAREIRAVAQAAIATVTLSWLTIFLAYLLFRWMESSARVSSKSSQLVGPFAFFYVVFPLLSSLVDLGAPQQRLISRATLEGAWRLEYLDDRTRIGSLRFTEGADGSLRLEGELLSRTMASPERGFRSTVVAEEVRFEPGAGRLEFDYRSGTGNGSAVLEAVPILTGTFRDRVGDASSEETNWGQLTAVKRKN